jgi:hypothetical protein
VHESKEGSTVSDRELKLNSISRYAKGSSRLVLEEHGHCEVPAGCGGVVLRWRNQNQSLPVEMWVHTNGEREFFLDGAHPSSGRPLLSYGEHVLAFRISGFDPQSGLLMFAGFYDEKEMVHVELSHRIGERIYILSVVDGSWKYSLVEPFDDTWKVIEFDDSTWAAMVAKPIPEPSEKDRGWYAYKKLTDFGAQGLGIETTGGNVWIRKTFRLERLG